MKKLVFGLLVAVSLVLSVGCAFATVDISQTHWQLPDRGFSGGSRVYPVDTVLTYTDLSVLRNSLNDSMQSRSAQLTYSGSFYFITMVRDGDIYWLCNGNGGRYRTAVESTDEPSSTVNNFNQTIINNSSGSASGSTGSPYVSSSWQEKELLGKIYEKLWFINEWLQITKDWVKEVNYNVKNVNTNINNNVVPALVAINKNLSSMLTDTVSRLSSIQSASWASVDAENRILSTLTGIGNQLGSVIRNGQLQVNTSPLEARLDKLISMYSKVNSVVLDTASVNGGQITGAVGGELKDVVFWGDTSKVNDTFVSADGVAYTLNDTPVDINGLTLRSVNMGSTIPSYIANDPVLYAGVWRKGTDYIISDTYNASTGEYVQRVETFVINNETCTSQTFFERAGNVGFLALYCPSLKFVYTDSPIQCSMLTTATYDSSVHSWSSNTSVNADRYDGTIVPIDKGFLWGTTNPDAFGWLASSSHAPCTIFYVPANGPFGGDPDAPVWSPTVQYFDPATIAIPEGSSYISSYNTRITGKYETYDTYTQTADIISGIGRTEALLSSINTDVQNIKSYTSSIKTTTSTISTNVGKVNTALTSVIKDGKFKVDNSDIVTALGKLDKLAELPTIKTAVDGVNTTISSVISQGRLKVDNSPVVTWLETINTTLTTNGGHSSTVDLSTIETTLSKICDKLDDAAVNVNNTVVNITNDNDKFNVFYITDVNGETQPITEFAGDLTGASGKLLSLLYRLVFADALSGVDDDFSGFEDFFTSQEPVTATQGVDDTVDEVTDVWVS